jgi:glycosyltransferase involved in cell wall biosynthesis
MSGALAARRIPSMYKLALPIPVHDFGDGRVAMPIGLERDLRAQLKFETSLRLICPRAVSIDHVPHHGIIDLAEYPGFSIRFLPWNGYRNSWPRAFFPVRAMLREEAADATTVGFAIGQKAAPGLRVLCLDSDPPSMLRGSGLLGSIMSFFVHRSLLSRVRKADVTIFVGRGVDQHYRGEARRSIATNAVWLRASDLADEESTRRKFAETGPVRIALPSRLSPWKGVDDAIAAVARLGDRLGPYKLDIIGEGESLPGLMAMVDEAGLKDRVRFLPPVAYGEEFFGTLRNYHIVLVPTRGLEEARIVYDAAASGCLLVHSSTETLEAILGNLPLRFPHQPADPESLARAIEGAIQQRDHWSDAAVEGIRLMNGRTIEEMHQVRREFLQSLRPVSTAEAVSPVP